MNNQEILITYNSEILGSGEFWRGTVEHIGEIQNKPARLAARKLADNNDGVPVKVGMWTASVVGMEAETPNKVHHQTQWEFIDSLPYTEDPVWLYEDGKIFIGGRFYDDPHGTWLWWVAYENPMFHDGTWDVFGGIEDVNPTAWTPLPQPVQTSTHNN